MRIRKTQALPLTLKVNAYRAADLFVADSKNRSKPVSAALVCQLNGFRKKCKRKLHTSHPSWDETFSVPLKPNDTTQLLVLTVWNRTARSKTYLGEVRLQVSEIFENKDELKTQPKWYKLYSTREQHSFVTGSILLLFEITKGKKTEAPMLVVNPPTTTNLKGASKGATKNSASNASLVSASMEKLEVSEMSPAQSLRAWVDSLLIPDPGSALLPDDQGFYVDMNDQMAYTGVSDFSDAESMDDQKQPRRISDPSNPLRYLQNSQSQALEGELSRSERTYLSVIPKTDGDLSASDGLSVSFSDGGLYSSDALEPKKRRFGRRKRADKDAKFELRNRKVMGVLFLEIISCSDLPPFRNFTRTTFDMDPFVVVTFGKKTVRTSWKRHTLNPIYNERMAFEVMEHERNYNIQFSVLDKDHFSFHDQVADISIPVKELTALAREPEVSEIVSEENGRPQASSTGSSSGPVPLARKSSISSFASMSDVPSKGIKIAEDENYVKTRRKKKFRKRRYTVLYVDTSRFKTLDLALTLHQQTMAEKHTPTLKLRARFLSYENLRRDFWRILLEQYNINESPGNLDYIELISLLDALGSINSDEIVAEFFKKLNRSTWGGDVLTHNEIIDCLEELVVSGNQSPEEKIFEIDRCPICCQKRLSEKQDIDIITHVAVCASKDWSIVNKLLVSSYVTPQAATKRWFTKFLIKLTYGKYQLGSNSANILVQDRSTGIIMEEKMSVSVRLGIRLLYKGLDKAKTKRIRALLRKLSVKQGIKFDNLQLVADIDAFIKFHKLDLSECQISNPKEFATFNEFFFRKLKQGARPVEAPKEDRIAVSPADCRCTTFVTVDSATELWIKGRNFTLAKLFNGNFNNLEKTDLYNPKNCCVGIFRLAPQDYHRFHSPVTGTVGAMKFIEGEYYTVNPMAIRSDLDVYGENVRVIVPFHTDHFGTVIMVAVGAMMVGSTVITVKEGQRVERGDDVGYFKFGGSTVLLLFERKSFHFDSDLVDNSLLCVETLVRVGQSIGHAPDVAEYKRERIEFSEQPNDFKLNLIRAITGGDLDNANHVGSWESENMKITPEDMKELMADEDLIDEDMNAEWNGELGESDEEGLIESE